MSGVECAGLVLAVLPLAIEAAKSYKNGVDTIRDVWSRSRRDNELEDFYYELWMEMFLLDRQLRDIVQALPFLKEDRKASLLSGGNLGQWTTESDVAEALQAHFNSETDYQAFMVIMGKIVQLLAQLIKDSTTHIEQKEMVSHSHWSITGRLCKHCGYPSFLLIPHAATRTKPECTGG